LTKTRTLHNHRFDDYYEAFWFKTKQKCFRIKLHIEIYPHL